MRIAGLIVAACCGLPAPAAQPAEARPEGVVRVATFNVGLNRPAAGGLVADLATPDDPQARAVAEIIQRVRPDILLVNEIDHDPAGRALDLFRANYLEVGQGVAAPIAYPYAFAAPVNTGVPSGLDLDRDGEPGGPGDALGYGAFPGQYGMAVLSRHPILVERARTFRTLLWRDLPGNLLPAEWYGDVAAAVLPLSSKSHWDVPVRIGDAGVLHVLASHPTPPVFDGPEDRNGRRNADEVRFWLDYLDGAAADHLVDDAGVPGGLSPADAPFVILGDLNLAPQDGDGRSGVIAALLDHPRVQDPEPRSAGGAAAAAAQGGANAGHAGDPALDTADFHDHGPGAPGNLRVDYLLPSAGLDVVGAGVFWPTPGEGAPYRRLIGPDGRAASDHRLVWVDLRLDRPPPPASR